MHLRTLFPLLLLLISSAPMMGCIADEAAPELSADAMIQAQPEAQVPEAVEIVIATFNVKQFFDTICDSNRCSAQSFEMVPTESEFQAVPSNLLRVFNRWRRMSCFYKRSNPRRVWLR